MDRVDEIRGAALIRIRLKGEAQGVDIKRKVMRSGWQWRNLLFDKRKPALKNNDFKARLKFDSYSLVFLLHDKNSVLHTCRDFGLKLMGCSLSQSFYLLYAGCSATP